jgi:hypothetical protein
MFRQVISEQQLFDEINNSVVIYCERVVSGTLLESQETLKQTIKKILIVNKEVSINLAITLARVIMFSSMMKELIDRKKRYTRHTSLARVYDNITQKTADKLAPANTGQSDTIYADFIAISKDVIAALTGPAKSREDVQQTFNAIIDRLETGTTEKNRLKVMKLASLIVQSNKSPIKRKEVIQQYVNEYI